MDTGIRATIKHYWLIFSKGKSSFQNKICKNLGHVSVLARDKYNWYILDPRPDRLAVEILPYEISDNVPLKLKRKNQSLKILKVAVNHVTDKEEICWTHIFMPHFVNCTTIVKYLIGIKIKAYTPYALYKKLKRRRKLAKRFIKNYILDVEEI
jgi:hypothetical protein